MIALSDSRRLVTSLLAALAIGLGACANTGVATDPGADDRALAADVADAARIRADLTALRARYNRPPAGTFMVAEPTLRRARARILAGRPPSQVLEDQLQLAADNGERDIAYWQIDVASADNIQFPAKLVRSGRLNVAIMVVRLQPQGNVPHLLVLFAMAEPDQSN